MLRVSLLQLGVSVEFMTDLASLGREFAKQKRCTILLFC